MQEEESTEHREKWNKGKEPFAGGKEKFLAVAKEDRSDYNKKMLDIQQRPGPAPVVFIKPYENSGKFNYEGFSLHYHCVEQTDSPKAIVVHIHGMNSHSLPTGYYASVVTSKNPQMNFYAFDQMNFGQSQGPYRGEIRSFEDTIRQTETFITFILGRLKSKPKIYLSGSSYGGTVSFKMGVNHP
jgi:hypothetical protein